MLLLPAALALSTEDAQAILQIEALRLPPLALQSFVASPDAATRARAARALGRLRDRAALGSLLPLTRDPDAAVRAEAAFALGQTPESGESLLGLLDGEADPTVRAAIVEALGKQGGEPALPVLLRSIQADGPGLAPSREATEAATAFGRLAARGVEGVQGPAVTGALLDALSRFDREIRRGAAFSLGRIAAPELPPAQRERLLTLALRDRDPVVRAFLLRASAAIRLEAEERDALYAAAARDPDSGVRVAAVRAGATQGWPGVAGLLADPETGVRLEAVTAIGKVDGLDHLALLEPILRAGSTLDAAEAARSRGDPAELLAATALAALAGREKLPSAGELSLDSLLAPERPTRIRAAAAAALTDKDRLLALAVRDGEAPVRTAAVNRLLSLEPRQDQVLGLFDAFDALVVASAAEHLAEHPLARAERPLLDALATAQPDQLDLLTLGSGALVALYSGARPVVRTPAADALPLAERLLLHPDPHVHEEATKLARLLGASPEPYQHRLMSVDLAAVERIRSARILTTRGEVVVTLRPQDAPITVWNWASLADRGWFDGLAFHRVVPDFVVQDGDPRGDGWGGPGYTIPDEIAPGHYDEGVLGMALSGPDTGGSQWFVTLAPQPHLDGTYTIFGEVSAGMQVLRAIQQGDRILRVTVERP